MSKQTSETSEKEFVCEGLPSNLYLSCKGEGFYKELNGKQYCILHYPASKDIERFGQALKGKMQSRDFFFDYIIFPVKTKFEGIECRLSMISSGKSQTSISDFSFAIVNA